MKFLLLFLVAFYMIFPLEAQQLQRSIDSLNYLLSRHTEQDTTRLKLLNELAFNYYSVSPDKGLELAMEAEQLAKKLHNINGMAVANSRIGVNYWAKGEYGKAMEYNNRAIAIYKESGNRLSYAKNLNNRGISHFALGDYVASLRDHEEALAAFQSLFYQPGVQHSYNNMGTVFLTLNDYPKALDAFLSALRVKGNDDPYLQASVLSNIGLVYKNWKQYDKALAYEQDALKIYTDFGSKRGMASCYSNIASLYDFMHQPGKAIEQFRKSLEINTEIGNREKVASDLTNLGMVYRDQNKKDSAVQYLKHAIELYREQGNKGDLSIAQISLASAIGGPPAEVLKIQEAALKNARESEIPLRISEALLAISETYEHGGQWAAAMKAFKEHAALKDSIYNQEKDREITRKQMSFDFEKKEAAAKAEIQRQSTMRKATMLAGGGLLCAAMLGFILYKRRRDMISIKKEAAFKTLVAETELKALRSQMNPHFIFNSLNSIGDYILKNDTKAARDYLANFSKLMRLTLENSLYPEISLQEDLKFVEMYLAVERKRLQGKFDYRISCSEAIDAENILLPPMLLQPFIENSIWHGFHGDFENGMIEINIAMQGNKLLCSIEDNGQGRRHADTVGKPASLGMSITRSRLDILNAQHTSGALATLQIIDKLKGVKVELLLPLIQKF
ncbi:hypothetical protein COR50_14950 [Chitinophaga caeni]|uniref:Signal transduction histidine kinase internal region domain-containing protein n=1 Tax=Chitinophaga caeni TaxID=2029983 RepID=A0A291QWW5_9BACT|nr:tetratricopeptide repeat protein [Chitinophaga caeni]ATL48353.1 hypothetical protein COR50_14950 [Chitinophaga caeni]